MSKKEKEAFLSPEEERDVAKKIKQEIEKMNTEVPFSLLPENIGPILNRPVKSVVKKHPMTTRWVAVAAAFAVVIGAVTLLPGVMQSNTGLLEGDSLAIAAVSEEASEGIMQSMTESEEMGVLGLQSKSPSSKDYTAVENALKKIAEYNAVIYDMDEKGLFKGAVDTASSTTTTAIRAPTWDASDDSDYSTTNIQVEGVDEPDIIKTDGKYLYAVTNSSDYDSEYGARLSIIQADKNGKMTLLNQIVSKDEAVSQIFLENNRLVLLKVPNNKKYYYNKKALVPSYDDGWTHVEIYDVSDPSKPTLTRRYEQEGNYTTARTMNGYLCLVTGKGVYSITKETKAEDVVPKVSDTLTGGERSSLPPEAITVMPDINTAYFTTITLLSISDSAKEASTKAIMAAGETYYANLENIYIASSRYDYSASGTKDLIYRGSSSTEIQKVSLVGGEVTPLSSGTVKGTLCSQFAMDEYDGYLRVATNLWSYDSKTSSQTNNFYVLDKDMKIVGKLEGLAPGETMYSVRFSGKTVYAVTYRQIDPFFVIDLTDPTKPVVKGELKIPGFSNYLHPYSDTLVIGFGMDTIETSSTTAITQGFKISMFDVSDPQSPKEVHKILIGDRGSYSNINYDHKALLFSKEKNLIGIPITIYKSDSSDASAYGRLTFEGYIVLGYDAQKGFYEKGRVTHIEDLSAAQYNSDGAYQSITRGVYIGDVLYTLSNNMVVSTSLTTFKRIDKVEMRYPSAPVSSDVPSSASSIVVKPAESKVY